MPEPRNPARRHRWFRQPLLHFLAMGALLFALFEWTRDTANVSTERIVVDNEALLEYAQAGGGDLAVTSAQEFVDDLSDTDFDKLLQAYVRQEVMYREAIAMGLERDDPVVRQRLIEKLQFIQENVAEPMREIQESEIVRHYEAHRDDYRQPAQITFAHVFFDNRNGGRQAAQQHAQQALTTLSDDRVPFREGASHGDAFHYQPNYVQRSQEMIAYHFSQRMAAELFRLPVAAGKWVGPLESPYGQHVVMVTHRSAGGLSPLEDVREEVEEDVRRSLADDNRQRVIQELIDRYDIEWDIERTPAPSNDSTATRSMPGGAQ